MYRGRLTYCHGWTHHAAFQNAVKGLKSAAGFIRRELGHQLKLRHVPELIFKATDSIEYSANISKILNDLKE